MELHMKYILLLMSITFANICCARTIEDLKKGNWVRDFIDHEQKLGTSPFIPTIQPDIPFPKNEIPSETCCEINKKVLMLKIKQIIYMVFFQEMGIIGGDFSDMAQGNAELAQDLKELFCVSFNRDDEIAQEKLDEFCQKWELEKIEISEAHTFYSF